MNNHYKPLDRVSRPKDVFNTNSKLIFGTVMARYHNYGSRFGPYPELYQVAWDNGKIGLGYFNYGITPASKPNDELLKVLKAKNQ